MSSDCLNKKIKKMFFKQKSNILFRNYESFGYLTDNRNFGYKQVSNDEIFIGDKILSESGSLFMSILTKTPQSLEVIVDKIMKHFDNVDIEVIKTDTLEFYSILERDGFIVSGKTSQECDDNDFKFSYNLLEPEIKQKNKSTANTHLEKSTQDFLEEFFNGKPQLTNLHIEITSLCNERCIHCYIPHDYKISYMKPDLFYSIIQQCFDLKLLHITISGGEPMVHKNFIDFLRKCREYDFSVNLLSNLTLLNEEIINEMKANPLLGVQVSLYSMDSEIHDEITQMKGSFEKTKNAILKLIENDIPLQISCPIMKQNKDSFKDVINWAKKHKIQVGDDYGIIASYNHTTQNLNCRLSIDEIKFLLEDKITNDSTYIEKLKIEAEKKAKSKADDFVCSVCNSSICIADNGNVYPCAGWQGYVVGNINKSSLKDIWENSDKVQYLRNLRKKDFSKCINCIDKEFCTMCMVRNANENSQGDPLIINDFFCEIAKLNKNISLKHK